MTQQVAQRSRYSEQVNQVPEFPRYINVARAAKILGISKTSVYYKIYEQKRFEVVYRVGGGPDADPDDRPYLLLLKAEVEAVAREEREAAEEVPLRIQITRWNQRVKQWGRENGFGVINAKGRPNQDLIDAYLQANPDDTRPA